MQKKPKILIAPLQWGLGHATRCIPIITALLAWPCEIIVGCGGAQKLLLQKEFPALRFVDLPNYNIRYSEKGWLNLFNITFQIPKILTQINREKHWLSNFLRSENLDLIIADNRYGLHASGVYSVFITHQLYIYTPFGKLINAILSLIQNKYIGRFSVCWIPDFKNDNSLAGDLSHPTSLPGIPIRYIGPLTRFVANERETDNLLVILSGPEPQRTIFENKVIAQLKNYSGNAVLVRGLPEEKETPFISSNISVYNHLPSEALNKLICQSSFIIGRSGYSTIMDIVSLGKKSILIPTPGQPEQIYLAKYLFEKKIIFTVNQHKFDLRSNLEVAKKFPFLRNINETGSLLSEAISELCTEILNIRVKENV
ncbi:MAG TPA: glycosyltransferase [Puia sp.]|nr:glycosyltransferase [Puia sp.]